VNCVMPEGLGCRVGPQSGDTSSSLASRQPTAGTCLLASAEIGSLTILKGTVGQRFDELAASFRGCFCKSSAHILYCKS
jgi:hypothetical protein